MDKGLTVPKWVLIVWLKILQMPKNLFPNLSAQAQKFWISMKKRLYWASVVRDMLQFFVQDMLDRLFQLIYALFINLLIA